MTELDELRLAYVALARMVHDEYPEGLSLVEIAETWGEHSPDEIAALRAIALRERQ